MLRSPARNVPVRFNSSRSLLKNVRQPLPVVAARNHRTIRKYSESRAAAQVGRRIDLRRVLVRVWVSTGGEFGTEVGAIVATIAIGLRVDDIATQSHQLPVPFQIQV